MHYPYETSALPAGYHDEVTFQIEEDVDWSEPGLKVIRLRILTDRDYPFWDVSYCHGMLDGRPVRVQLPFDRLPKRGFKKFIVECAKKEKIFAKGLGILDDNVISKLW